MIAPLLLFGIGGMASKAKLIRSFAGPQIRRLVRRASSDVCMMMVWLILALVAWLLWAAVCSYIVTRQPRKQPGLQDEVLVGLAYVFCKSFVGLMHRGRATGVEHVPARGAGPLIVVSNHTAGLDPMLIQAFCPFEITWMMGRDMMMPRFDVIWELLDVIAVDRGGTGKAGRDTAALRRAVKLLKAGGVVGIFPEGHIPERGLGEFSAGVGMIAAMSGAPVLVVRVSGTPKTDRAWKSLITPSQSRVEFLGLERFEKSEKSEAITARLRGMYEE